MKSNLTHLYSKLLGALTKKGKKTKAKKILNQTFLLISKKKKISIYKILLKIFFQLNTFVEVKKILVKRGSHIVPFSINFKRRLYLIVKWLMQSIKLDQRQVSLSIKLTTEIIKLIEKKTSFAYKAKESNIAQALLNRSNAHYRW